jgi:hypothetical protein
VSSKRELILGNVEDLVADFLYYDRKEDEELPRGAIEQAIREGVITADEIVAEFGRCLRPLLLKEAP